MMTTEEEILADTGITLRDYFASQAMTANIQYAAKNGHCDQEIAGWCYAIADAMLSERAEPLIYETTR